MDILSRTGNPSATNRFLFNGDFVDRGRYSLETIVYLMTWKVALPNSIHLNRGNHEEADINEKYGFLSDLEDKLGFSKGAYLEWWNKFNDAFSFIPLGAVVRSSSSVQSFLPFLVVHAGLPKEAVQMTIAELNDTKKVNRVATNFREAKTAGIISTFMFVSLIH